MPTIEVTSSPLTPSARLKTALRLTKWLTAHGSDPTHVAVQFQTAEPMTYFAGGIPLSRFDDEHAAQRHAEWASVICHVHYLRDHSYRRSLAEEVRASLGITDGHCVVRFEPTEPDRVFFLDNQQMTVSSPALVGAVHERGQRP